MNDSRRDHFALVNGRIVLPNQVVIGKALLIEGDHIEGLASPDELGSAMARVDVGGRLVTPGLIDIHTHGALGRTFNEPTAEAFGAITAENARRGVTSLLATLATSSIRDLTSCLDFCRKWIAGKHGGASVLGAYIEGPYISMAQKGALDPDFIRTPSDGTGETWLAYRDVLRIMTLAPELPGAVELTRRLADAGIIPSAGHTAAYDSDVAAAMAAGLRHVTHIWSGQSMTIRQGAWRKPGVVEAALTFEGLSVEMISDNKHLPPTLMKLAYKCIGPDRLCAISDATSGAGLPEGARFRMGAMEYEVHDGVGMMLDRTAFAGSTTLLGQMLPVLTGPVGIPLREAVRMVTLTPARVLGIETRKGSLTTGKDADLAVFDDDFTVWRTMIAGRWVYGLDVPSVSGSA